jgi:hypothetical protein
MGTRGRWVGLVGAALAALAVGCSDDGTGDAGSPSGGGEAGSTSRRTAQAGAKTQAGAGGEHPLQIGGAAGQNAAGTGASSVAGGGAVGTSSAGQSGLGGSGNAGGGGLGGSGNAGGSGIGSAAAAGGGGSSSTEQGGLGNAGDGFGGDPAAIGGGTSLAGQGGLGIAGDSGNGSGGSAAMGGGTSLAGYGGLGSAGDSGDGLGGGSAVTGGGPATTGGGPAATGGSGMSSAGNSGFGGAGIGAAGADGGSVQAGNGSLGGSGAVGGASGGNGAAGAAGASTGAFELSFPGWQEGSAVNRSTLPLQITVPGSTGAEVLLDGVPVKAVAALGCLGDATLDVLLDIATVAPGPHTLTVRAGGAEKVAHFASDPTAPLVRRNSIEARAYGQSIACFDASTPTGDTIVEGDLVLGLLSDGLDPSKARVILAANRSRTLYEATSLACTNDSTTGYQHCTGSMSTAEWGKSIELEQVGDRSWHVRVAGGTLPAGTDHLGLRFGDNETMLEWPTLRRASLGAPSLDTARSVKATIGSGGGKLSLTDAAGVKVELTVPMDALSKPVELTMTPLVTRPMAPSVGLQAGVRFEPQGLRFVVPARLTLEFPSSVTLTQSDRIVLETSPLTVLRLPGAPTLNGQPFGPATDRANRKLVAHINHFTTMTGAEWDASEEDFREWANAAIVDADNGTLDIDTLRSLLDLQADAQALGTCVDPACAMLANLTDSVSASMQTVADAACAAGHADPAIEDVDRIMRAESLSQEMGGTPLTGTMDCMGEILVELCKEAGAEAAAKDPVSPMLDSDDPMLDRMLASSEGLNTVYAYGDQLGLTNVTTVCTEQAVAAGTARAARLSEAGAARGGPLYDRERMVDLYEMGVDLHSDDLHSTGASGLFSLVYAAIEHARVTCAASASDGQTELTDLRTWVTTATPADFQADYAPNLLAMIDERMPECGKGMIFRSSNMKAACVISGGSSLQQTTDETEIHDLPHTTTCSVYGDAGSGVIAAPLVSVTLERENDEKYKFKLSGAAAWSGLWWNGGYVGAYGQAGFHVLRDGHGKMTLEASAVTMGADCDTRWPSYTCADNRANCGCQSAVAKVGNYQFFDGQPHACHVFEQTSWGTPECGAESTAKEVEYAVKLDDWITIYWMFETSQAGTTYDGDIATIELMP